MQKMTRVVLAVLAVAGTTAAMAQSSVTLYGRVNTTVERQKLGDVSSTGMFNNSSRFGFKGTEDLGGGLKAGFQLESGFNSDTGAAASTFFGRQSEVNLSGNFGMVRLGNFFAESYYATADYVSSAQWGTLQKVGRTTSALPSAVLIAQRSNGDAGGASRRLPLKAKAITAVRERTAPARSGSAQGPRPLSASRTAGDGPPGTSCGTGGWLLLMAGSLGAAESDPGGGMSGSD